MIIEKMEFVDSENFNMNGGSDKLKKIKERLNFL
jgi:hypothetical protein